MNSQIMGRKQNIVIRGRFSLYSVCATTLSFGEWKERLSVAFVPIFEEKRLKSSGRFLGLFEANWRFESGSLHAFG